MNKLRSNQALQRGGHVVGLAILWMALHDQLFCPVGAIGPTTSFGIVVSGPALLVALLLLLMPDNLRRTLFHNRGLIAASGVVGAAGAALMGACGYAGVASAALVALSVAAFAFYLVIQTVFWLVVATQGPAPTLDLSVSFALACLCISLFCALGVETAITETAGALIATLLVVAQAPASPGEDGEAGTLTEYRPLLLITLGFIVLCTLGIVLSNSITVDENPAQARAAFYALSALVFGVAGVVAHRCAPGMQALVRVLATFSTALAALLLVTYLLEEGYPRIGMQALVAGRVLFEGFGLMVLTSRRGLVSLKALVGFFALTVPTPSVISWAFLLAQPLNAWARATISPYLITAICTLVVCVGTTATLLALMRRLSESTVERQEENEQAMLARVGGAWGLSAREMDVLRYAYHNWSAQRIADELFVATSTVYSHLKSIYHKADVHSKQELIDKIDASA